MSGEALYSDMKINSMAVALCHVEIKFHLGPRMSKTKFFLPHSPPPPTNFPRPIMVWSPPPCLAFYFPFFFVCVRVCGFVCICRIVSFTLCLLRLAGGPPPSLPLYPYYHTPRPSPGKYPNWVSRNAWNKIVQLTLFYLLELMASRRIPLVLRMLYA